MKLNKILFATDFSEFGDAALARATALAAESNAMLLIVHVQEPPRPYVTGEFGVPPIDTSKEAKKWLSKVTPPDERVCYEHHLLIGDPAREIVRFAEEQNVDEIVLGTHGRSGFSRLLMGSVAESVVRRATCPVLTLKQPRHGGCAVNTID